MTIKELIRLNLKDVYKIKEKNRVHVHELEKIFSFLDYFAIYRIETVADNKTITASGNC